MCLITLEDLKKLNKKTLIYFAAEEDEQTYIEESFKIVVGQELNALVKELRVLDVKNFPIVCYDNEDLSLASRAYWIFEAMDYEVKILVTSRGLGRPIRPVGPLPHKTQISHIDISRISNSILYQTQEFNLLCPIVPNIAKDLSQDRVRNFLEGQQIPVEIEGTQLIGFYAEQIAALLKYLDNDVNVLLTEVKMRTKTVESKFNETFVSLPESIYYDAEEDLRSRVSESNFGDFIEKNSEKVEGCRGKEEITVVEKRMEVVFDEVKKTEIEENKEDGEKKDIKSEEDLKHYSNGLSNKKKARKQKKIMEEGLNNSRCFCSIL